MTNPLKAPLSDLEDGKLDEAEAGPQTCLRGICR